MKLTHELAMNQNNSSRNKIFYAPPRMGMSCGVIVNGEQMVIVDRGESIERLAREGRKHSPANEAKAVTKEQAPVPYYRQFDKRQF